MTEKLFFFYRKDIFTKKKKNKRKYGFFFHYHGYFFYFWNLRTLFIIINSKITRDESEIWKLKNSWKL